MDCSMPGFPVVHYLPEFAPTHVHGVSDAIQPLHPLPSPSPSALFASISGSSSSYQVAKVLEISASASVFPMNIQSWFPLGWTGWISLKPYNKLFFSHINDDVGLYLLAWKDKSLSGKKQIVKVNE